MNILVACLGGTIGSSVNSNLVKLDENRFDDKYFKKINSVPNYRVIAPVTYSSENADISLMRKAIKGIYDAVAEERPDAILILHGTDSMASFAQLAVRTLSTLKLPVVITGSKLPADNPNSDAKGNLRMSIGFLDAAVEGNVRNKTFGVVFTDSFTNCPSFVSACQITAPDVNGDYKPVECDRTDYSETKYISKAVEFINKEDSDKDNILVIPAMPSFPYEALGLDGYGNILIESYHSGTADSVKLPEFIKKATEAGHECFLAPVPNGLLGGRKENMYESTKVLKDLGVKLLGNMPLEGAWAEVAVFK